MLYSGAVRKVPKRAVIYFSTVYVWSDTEYVFNRLTATAEERMIYYDKMNTSVKMCVL